MLPLGHPATQFGDSFPEKLMKNVATRDEIFSLKFTKYRLAAGLHPDPLKRSPRPPSRNKGGLLLRGGEREGRGRKMRECLTPQLKFDKSSPVCDPVVLEKDTKTGDKNIAVFSVSLTKKTNT